MVGKPAKQGEAQSYTEPEVYMQKVHGGKEHVLTWGGLTDAASTEVTA